ncbi:RNA chaperone Hfq [Natranaerobius thermophilus]|uniref:RNA-binding protein Hfq n=1 Tax=Natranaerobius thermophilus (strain ATCC BAA-1301 / DSM 18059 / JW/NM-WN-LF) TaxID=457570 RepID=HFQ_NATTJ|nr:RNA chaperone Hfq [Natranaerobius thermophilus]B2A3Y0.1 RecName: Full=RNA-binding protein Hfq [Natranaerobius thermophilus JW/NM-WN-LF]ACB85082.1 RNA-binding protein Hfq [Natranaerobius thermophilus JW/NM-WN-LF]
MSKNTINLQDNVLNQVRKNKITVTIFLVNGYKIRGLIKSFDNFTLLMEVNGEQQMIYKHAVSTIIPGKTLNLFSDQSDKNDQEQ